MDLFEMCLFSVFFNFGLTYLFLDFNYAWISVNGVLTIFFLINKVATFFSKFILYFLVISSNFFMRCFPSPVGYCFFHCGRHRNAKW